MAQSGSQAAAFFRDVRQSSVVWLVRDDDGSPTHLSSDGTRSLPFWSTSPRAQRAAKIWLLSNWPAQGACCGAHVSGDP
ncbi:DUF2750 domain-containing protein [Streptomyces canus]|uniref:DUF2750 domain-containing protein n=1 Tax=Streptomyces canus TaxID=58343 RepID=UPI002E30082B|nr:DUF2750 domain-containing protein [Streptomyces canus]